MTARSWWSGRGKDGGGGRDTEVGSEGLVSVSGCFRFRRDTIGLVTGEVSVGTGLGVLDTDTTECIVFSEILYFSS